MPDSLVGTLGDWGLVVLRLGLGIVFIGHGWMKLNPNGPMMGPAGFAGFLKQLGVPEPAFFAWIVALLGTVGSILLILGLGTRILALGLVINMLVAIFRVRIKMGNAPFIGGQTNGWELEFLLVAMALALILTGAGRIGLDSLSGL